MPLVIYKSRFIIAIVMAALLLFTGCKKGSIVTPNQNALEQYFEDNILNKDFTVHFASDNGADITAQYSGITFKLLKNTYYDGVMTATNSLFTINGTWSSNSDYSKLVITLPATTFPSFAFLSREWKFTKKAVPIMELAPWGTTEPDILHMQRQ
jgi:hypothetical protein